MAPLTLPSSQASLSVKVQPTVLLTICDAYLRRSENQERVVGTLLGTLEGAIVDVKNCYAVPFNESQEQVRDQGPACSAPLLLTQHIFIAADQYGAGGNGHQSPPELAQSPSKSQFEGGCHWLVCSTLGASDCAILVLVCHSILASATGFPLA